MLQSDVVVLAWSWVGVFLRLHLTRKRRPQGVELFLWASLRSNFAKKKHSIFKDTVKQGPLFRHVLNDGSAQKLAHSIWKAAERRIQPGLSLQPSQGVVSRGWD